MKIFLKFDWKIKVSKKAKVYSLDQKNRNLMNDIFDQLHRDDKLFWIIEFTSFSYFLFCVWKIIPKDEKKERVIVDIRKFNAITQSNAYSLFLQSDIIQLIASCSYIIIINAASFFYQWRVHSDDRHKFIVINHRKQKSFNVTVIKYKNSSAYVQRQIDRVLRKHKKYSRAYVDDIIIFSKTLKKHLRHLIEVFDTLNVNNIFIKSTKTFIEYFIVNLLNQKINSFDLIIAEDKLKVISLLKFPRILQQLKTYLKLISYLREYVSFYAGISQSL